MTIITFNRRIQVNEPADLPAWLQGAPLYEWVEVPNSRIDQAIDWNNYTAVKGVLGKRGLLSNSGGAIKASGSEFFIAGGGHADYAGNEIFSIKLGQDSPKWQRLCDPTPNAMIPWNTTDVPQSAYYDDGRPSSRHTYWSMHFIDQTNHLMFACNQATFGNGNGGFGQVDAFDVSTGLYLPAGTFPSGMPAGAGAPSFRDGSGNMYVHSTQGPLRKWDRASNTVVTVRNHTNVVYETAYACDTTRNLAFRVRNGGAATGYYDLNDPAAPFHAVTLQGADAAALAPSGAGQNRTALMFDTANGCFWALRRFSTTLYRIDVSGSAPGNYVFTVTAIPTTGAAVEWGSKNGSWDMISNTYSRHNYAPELKALVWMARDTLPMWVMRTA